MVQSRKNLRKILSTSLETLINNDELDKYLSKDIQYSHCVADGFLYVGKYEKKLFYVGITIPSELKDYNISSGLCLKCYNYLKRKRKRK